MHIVFSSNHSSHDKSIFGLAIPIAEHPIIYTHPESGHVSLYASGPPHAITIGGMSAIASFKLMTLLHDHILQTNNVYLHKWHKGDMLIWDNLVTLHRSLDNYGVQPQLLYRTQVKYGSTSHG
jgi:taurine dioxygenase